MKSFRIPIALLCLALGSVAFAQKPAAPKKADNVTVTVDKDGIRVDGAAVTAAADNIACSNKVQPTTGFTECEMLRLSNYMNQLNAVQSEADRQKQPVAAAADDFIGKVVARNAGKQYEAPSKQFPLGRLIPIPPPPAAAAATPAPPIGPHTGPLPTPEATPPAAAPAPTPAQPKK